MVKASNNFKQDIIKKNDRLNEARQILKEEFVGIDSIVDEIIESISSWYFFPDLQEKPVVVNLWGLTGVGKSSLVRRLSELLSFDKKFYQFDLGDAHNKGQSIEDQLEYVFGNVNGFPIMVSFDEFQYARAIDNYGEELSRSASRVIWELLDSGKYQIPDYKYQVSMVYKLKEKLSKQLKKGVKVEKGYVMSEKKSFIQNLWAEDDDLPFIFRRRKPKSKNLLFVQSFYYEIIYTLAREMFESALDVKDKLLTLNGRETIEFLHEVYELGNSPKIIDCSKAVIFVIGNLDEAYHMSNNFSADFSADEFHEQSLKINISDIKEALKRRFRNEQISRLGNNHIIYPALNSASYRKIIELELKRIAEKFEKSQKLKLSFDKSLSNLIFEEGVYPTQGVRPLHSTIHQLVNSKLGLVVSKIQLKQLNADEVKLKIEGQELKIEFLLNGDKVDKDSEKLKLKLSKLRKNKKDDLQAISAVHESGHAIISIILLHTIPEVIFSQSTDYDAHAFIYTKFKNRFVQKNELVPRIAMNLGGLVAEKIIFGHDNITTGAASDIESATFIASSLVKESGMGKTIAAVQVPDKETNDYLFDTDNEVNKEIFDLLDQGAKIAEETLTEQKALLLRMADYLSDNRKLDKKMIMKFVKEHAVDFDMELVEKKQKGLFFRELLKSKVQDLNEKDSGLPAKTYDVALNKERDKGKV